jgi:hypothetical protein
VPREFARTSLAAGFCIESKLDNAAASFSAALLRLYRWGLGKPARSNMGLGVLASRNVRHCASDESWDREDFILTEKKEGSLSKQNRRDQYAGAVSQITGQQFKVSISSGEPSAWNAPLCLPTPVSFGSKLDS